MHIGGVCAQERGGRQGRRASNSWVMSCKPLYGSMPCPSNCMYIRRRAHPEAQVCWADDDVVTGRVLLRQAKLGAQFELRCAFKAHSMRLDDQTQVDQEVLPYRGKIRSSSQLRRRPTEPQGWQLMPTISRWHLPVVVGEHRTTACMTALIAAILTPGLSTRQISARLSCGSSQPASRRGMPLSGIPSTPP